MERVDGINNILNDVAFKRYNKLNKAWYSRIHARSSGLCSRICSRDLTMNETIPRLGLCGMVSSQPVRVHVLDGGIAERRRGGKQDPNTRLAVAEIKKKCRYTAEQSGRLLLKSYVCYWTQRYSAVHVFLFDVHPEHWLPGIPAAARQRLTVHDGFSDPLGWNGGTTSGVLQDISVKNYLSEIPPDHRGSCAVVFDSLSTLLLYHSATQICRLLHALAGEISCLLSMLHADLHEDHVISQISHVTSITIHIRPVEPELSAAEYHGKCSIVHQKKSGKVVRKTELVSIGKDLSVTGTEVSSPAQTDSVGDKPPDPTANLTFNLTLTEREKEDRSRVVLPYTHASERKPEPLQVGAGKIFYQPDDADDFDESDPDDDLDI